MNKYLVAAKYGLIKNINDIPLEERSREVIELAAKKYCELQLEDIPKEMRTEAVYIAAFGSGTASLEDVPKEMRTEAVYVAALECVGASLEDVPKKMRTEKVYAVALRFRKASLEDVPKEMRTEAIYVAALQSGIIVLEYIPEEMRTEAVYAAYAFWDGLEDVPEEMRTENVYAQGLIGKVIKLEDVPEEMRTETIYAAYVFWGSVEDVPKEKRTEAVYVAALRAERIALEDIPEESRTPRIYSTAIEENLLNNWQSEYDNIEGGYRYKYPDITEEELREICAISYPNALINKGDYEKILEYIEEKLINTQDKKKVFENARKYMIGNQELVEEFISVLWFYSELPYYGQEYEEGYNYIHNNPDNSMASYDYIFNIVKNISEFDRVYSICPPLLILQNWEKNAEEFNGKEYKKLLDTGIIKKSTNYNQDYHEKWILKMYQVFGYDNAMKLLGEIPEITPEFEEKLKEMGNVYKEVFDKKYILTGEIAITDEIINRLNNFAGKNALQLFKELNIFIENGEEWNLEELIKEIGIDEDGLKRIASDINSKISIGYKQENFSNAVNEIVKNNHGMINNVLLNIIQESISSGKYVSVEELKNILETEVEKILTEINAKININKLEKTKNSLKMAVDESIEHHQGIMVNVLTRIIKDAVSGNNEVTIEELKRLLDVELERRNENGQYVNSPLIQNSKENLVAALEKFMANNENKEILNDDIIKLLKRSKEELGRGWMRKLVSIPHEMSEAEYKNACQILCVSSLEHEEVIKLKGNTKEEKEIARDLLKSVDHPEILTFEKLEIMFGGLTSPYSEKFGNYFMEHKEEMMESGVFEYFAKMHNAFEDLLSRPAIKTLYDDGRLEVATILSETLNNTFQYGEGEAELAIGARQAQLELKYWEDARELHKIVIQREETTIPPTKIIKRKYRGRMRRVDDCLGMFDGNITGCCQVFGNVGQKSMEHGMRSKNGGIFVVEELNEKGEVVREVAQSWVWRNDDVMCFDNIEALKSINFTKEEQEEILSIYQEAAETAIKIDESSLRKMLKNNEITETQYRHYVLKEVRLGLGYNGIPILEEKSTDGKLEKTYDVVTPKAGEDYGWIDSEQSVILARHDKLTRQNKNTNERGAIPVTYSKPREILKLKGEEIHEDIVEILKDIEKETFRAEQQIMQDSHTVTDIANVQGCSVEQMTVVVSRDKDWYAMYYEQNNNVYIADIALINGSNAQKSGNKSSDTICSSLELAKTMFELLLEFARKGKIITCDATKDTSGLNIKNMVKQGLIKIESGEEYNWGKDIEMEKMVLIPDENKLEREIKVLAKKLEKAEERNRIYRKNNIGGEDR